MFIEKKYTLKEINEIIDGILTEEVKGITIKKVAPPLLADENTLALALNEEEIENISQSEAKAAVVPLGVTIDGISTIEVKRTRLAMMKLLHLFYIPADMPKGIHDSAIIDPSVKLGENVSIGANVVIERNTIIGNNTKLRAGVYIGKGVMVGDDCLIHPHVSLNDFVKIGNRVILHNGVVIGADGYSFVTENPSTVEIARQEGKKSETEQKIYKIPSLGSVEIKDDVEIGANSTVDRGTLENTIVAKGTKIDNLVMLAHNCKIGENCMLVAQSGVAGSSELGDRVVLAGQSGLCDHIKVGADSIIMAKTGVTKSFPEKSILMGTPALPRKEFVRRVNIIKRAEVFMKEFKEKFLSKK